MNQPQDPNQTIDALPADSLEVGLAVAFGKAPGPPRSSLGDMRPALLKEADGDSAVVVLPKSDAMPSKDEAGDRYQLSGEIARGGMGVVLRGRDVDLGRDLAVKVLLAQYADRPDVARRFIEEAQIGGQLQHPGVVPVYDIGHFGDRPFFTMKLVKGQTLAAILAERNDPAADRPRLLGIALQVAQAVAYAHAKGVIHRDLKPANIMVGAFGEVQVVDWGLAKVLTEGGVADEKRARRTNHAPEDVTTIRTARSIGSAAGTFGTDTEAGSIMGTPAYMPPEQAGGDVALLDRRTDVFGLGAILCEVLTGKPPYVGRSSEELHRKAANGDLADATARLDACGAEQELIALTKRSLAAEAVDRPRNAQEVADGLSAYLVGVQERLREATRERVVAEARAVEERRRRKVQLALAAAVLALTVLGGLSGTYYLRQTAERAALRAEQAAAVDRVVGQAVTLLQQARDQPEDLTRWQVALAAVKQAEAGDPAARPRLRTLHADVQAGLDAARRDKELLDRLIDIRSASSDDPSGAISDQEYADAFRAAGIDLNKLPPPDAGAVLGARPHPVALAMAVALDDWAAVRRTRRGNTTGALRLSEAASIADPEPWRVELRSALDQTDGTARRTAFLALEKRANFEELGPISMLLLARGLSAVGEVARSESVLRKAQPRFPQDVWINYELGKLLDNLGRGDEGLRFLTAAGAIRPETSHALGHALERRGAADEAIAVFQHLNRVRPGNALHLGCLGRLLHAQGRVREANEVLGAAVAAARDLVHDQPDHAENFCKLGYAQAALGRADEAIASFKRTVELDPNHTHAYSNIGSIYCDQKKDPETAISYFRKAIEQDPKESGYHFNLGNALFDKARWDEAIESYRRAVELDPNDLSSLQSLGMALKNKGQVDEAVTIYRKAVEIAPTDAESRALLGRALKSKGRVDDAIASFRKAIELDPKRAVGYANLGDALKDNGQVDEAIACYRKAIELEPKLANAHNLADLAGLYRGRKLHRQAVDLYATAFGIGPGLADDLAAGHRYNAARSAALAAGQDAISDDERTRLRKQALDWLRADLALATKQLQSIDVEQRTALQKTLLDWQTDPDLAGIRDAAAVSNLPAQEQNGLNQLWNDVAAIQRKREGLPE